MYQQVQVQQQAQLYQNPQLNVNDQTKKQKPNKFKKKGFKIQKSRNSSLKKKNVIQNFNNPLYADLQNQDHKDENQHNFGPWIHQQFNMTSQSSQKRNTIIQSSSFNILTNQTITQQNFMNVNPNDFRTTIQRQFSTNQIYLQIPLRNAILQDSDHTTISYLPQIKPKRQLHQVRLSTLDFTPEKNQVKKPVHLSPPKIVKHKQSFLTRNKSQGQVSELKIKYDSLKPLLQTQEILNKKLLLKPSNVIYNYCYSNNENNNVLNYFKDQNFISSQRRFISTLKRSESIFKQKSDLKRSQSSLFRQYNSCTLRQSDAFRETSLFKNNKINMKIEIKKIKYQKYTEPIQNKKSITKQLYEDLIRKKNKGKGKGR